MKFINELWEGLTNLIGTWAIMFIFLGSIFAYAGLLKIDCNTHGMCVLYLK